MKLRQQSPLFSFWIACSIILLSCQTNFVQGNLEGCTLYAGGEFTFSSSTQYSSLLGLDVTTGEISPITGPGVYRDSFPDSLYYFSE